MCSASKLNKQGYNIQPWRSPFPIWKGVCCSISSSFTASSFTIWNSSTGIPSAPLALLVVMLPEAHLISQSRKSGSRWVIIPSWLSRSWRSFLDGSVYSCYLFLMSPASVRSIAFLIFIVPTFAWNVHFKEVKSESEGAQSDPPLSDPMGCSLPGSSVRGIFQAWILEWVAISFPSGSSWPRGWTWVSRIAGRCFTDWATREDPRYLSFSWRDL